MSTSATKIAIGVSCGILLAVALILGSCIACFGFGAARVAEEMKQRKEAESHLRLRDGWEFTTSSTGSKTISGKVQNNGYREFHSVTIEFNLYDDAGNLVGTASDSISNLEPRGAWAFEAHVFNDSASTAKFKGFSAY